MKRKHGDKDEERDLRKKDRSIYKNDESSSESSGKAVHVISLLHINSGDSFKDFM